MENEGKKLDVYNLEPDILSGEYEVQFLEEDPIRDSWWTLDADHIMFAQHGLFEYRYRHIENEFKELELNNLPPEFFTGNCEVEMRVERHRWLESESYKMGKYHEVISRLLDGGKYRYRHKQKLEMEALKSLGMEADGFAKCLDGFVSLLRSVKGDPEE